MLYNRRNCITEWAYTSGKAYTDPFNDVELDVVITDPDGQELTVPAFWAGDQTWRVRFAPRQIGQYTYRTVCSDAGNADLHGQTGTLMVARYNGDNPLLRRGFLRVAADRRHLEHADGTPFLWLADTWWMGFTQRLAWPADFQQLTADRVTKGFSVVQIVAGLYPDMDWYDERGMNEAGFPWTKDFSRINPAYFDMADSAHRPPGAIRDRAVHRRRVGLLHGFRRQGCAEEALALHRRPLQRLPRHLVRRGRGDDELLPAQGSAAEYR